MLGQPSGMLMRVFSGPVCPPWGLISDRILTSGVTSCLVIGLQEEGSSEGREDGRPHAHRKPQSLSQETILLPFLLRS